MKLRNKQTGEIVDVESLGHAESLKEKYGYLVTLSWKTEYENLSQCKDYESLAELNADWEDYKPAEPLIKNEKIRKAVRAWAEANDIRFGRRCGSLNAYSKRIVGWNAVGVTFTIEFDKDLKVYGDNITKDVYTIAELCGEEEE